MTKFAAVFLLCAASAVVTGEFLKVSGVDFYYGGQKVFLSGANAAWSCYGCDFGNNRYGWGSGAELEKFIKQVAQSGGNIIRVWVHIEGEFTPQFDSNGYVTATDGANTLISDLKQLLDTAYNNKILVMPVLWSGAKLRQEKYKNLIWDDSKISSYINNALKPMVRSLKYHPALAAWEIMNEPEGSLQPAYDSDPCYNTQRLVGSGTPWSGVGIPAKRLVRFIALQAKAIHEEDPKALVTVGSWSERAQNSVYGDSVNLYTDKCMAQAADGSSLAKLDFQQMHTYGHGGKYNANAPYKVPSGWSYGLGKPLVIGEFAAACSEGQTTDALFQKFYNNGYQGALSWHLRGDGDECTDTNAQQQAAMSTIRYRTDHGTVGFKVY